MASEKGVTAGREGFFKLIMTIDGFDIEIKKDDISSLLLIESCGFDLPTFEVSFSTMNKEILNYLKVDKKLRLHIEGLSSEPSQGEFFIAESSPTMNGEHKYSIKLACLMDRKDFFMKTENFISNEMTSIEVIKEKLGKMFTVKSDVTNASDKMRWLCDNRSLKKFLINVIMRSYLTGNGCLFCGFDMGGNLYLKDIMKLKSSFVLENAQAKIDKENVSGIKYKSVTPSIGIPAFYEFFGGAVDKIMSYNIDDDQYNVVNLSSDNPYSTHLTDTTGKIPSFEIQDSNTHANYSKAKPQNIRNISKLSQQNVLVSIVDYQPKIKPLSCGTLLTGGFQGEASYEMEMSGVWVVTKVVTTLNSNLLSTNILLSRPGLNI